VLLETELKFKFSGSWIFQIAVAKLIFFKTPQIQILFLLSLRSSSKAMVVLYLLLKFIECL
jgi:hypothetical protein